MEGEGGGGVVRVRVRLGLGDFQLCTVPRGVNREGEQGGKMEREVGCVVVFKWIRD